MKPNISETLLARFSEVVADYTGLHFARNRLNQLERVLLTVYPEFGYSSAEDCIKDLIAHPIIKERMDILVQYLTIGETYFFRDKMLFQNLEQLILPKLIRGRKQPLRIWSAGCSTGEEPYSIAILLDEMFGRPKEGFTSITATDINLASLKKAMTGVYTNWSFRDTPAWVKNRYFIAAAKGHYEVCPRIKDKVSFSYLNLVRDQYPLADMIICRNVLMYLVPDLRKMVIQKFYHCLAPDGLLIVAPSEIPQVSEEQFTPLHFPGLVLYKKASLNQFTLDEGEPFLRCTSLPPNDVPNFDRKYQEPANNFEPQGPVEAVEFSPKAARENDDIYQAAQKLFVMGQYDEVIDRLQESLARVNHTDSAKAMALLAKAYANLGELIKAEDWCNRAISQHKFGADFHFLLATILQEQGKVALAIQSLMKAIYLNPDFLSAHFSMANLYKQIGKDKESKKYFENTLILLKNYQAEEILPEFQGLTAGRLKEIIESSLQRS
ncbi:CheR family methyltransferase [Desulfotomaculum sp. 1211_IL3151]|uniref:CheR family methyltransferase n=1 Tax=Desulfotomaculum sp. 1211_IL3151 TaxID=3084055 RepID=UPI002FDAAA65